MIMAFIGRTFARGLIVVLPAVVTVYLLWLLLSTVETLVGWVLDQAGLEPEVYGVGVGHGIGVVLVVVVVFVIGLLMKSALAQQFYRAFESLLGRVPLVKTLYGSVRDLMGFFSGEKSRALGKVVMVDLNGDGRQRLIGFLTRDSFGDLPEGVGDERHVAVYLPMSYQLGGFTTIMPRDSVEPIDMPIEQAMRFALTAGVTTHEDAGGEGGKRKGRAGGERGDSPGPASPPT